MRNKQIMPLLLLVVMISMMFSISLSFNNDDYSLAKLTSAAQLNEHRGDYVVEIFGTPDNGQVQVISKVSREVSVGDEIITGNNSHYRVISIENNQATTKYLGDNSEVLNYSDYFKEVLAETISEAAAQTAGDGSIDQLDSDSGDINNRVGIYHTHTDESYVPSDGTDNIPGNGGIYQVGAALDERLSEEGVDTYYDTTVHDPHDSNAYDRSRVTAVNLIEQNNPIALLDVHRDGIPDPEYYEAEVAGEDITQMRLVVGRANPKMEANLDFAQRLKAYADEVYPGLIKEIYMAKGDYNQDLMSTALLIEAGTHTNAKEAAERGIQLLANVVPTVLGIDPAAEQQNNQQPYANSERQSSGAIRSIGWLVGIVIIGLAIFLVIRAGSVTAAWKQVKLFFTKELSDIWTTRRKK